MKQTTAIFGPPGTGKTRLLVSLVSDYYPKFEKSMAVVSFSKSAAQELTNRINKVPAFVGTLHSLCFHHLNLKKNQVAQAENFNKYLTIPDIDEVKSVLQLGGLARRLKISIEEVYTRYKPDITWNIFEFYWKSYINWKNNYYLVDFDDMLERTMGKVKFDVIIVDEAQDLSLIQLDLIKSMIIKNGILVMAGDDDQSIYIWSGAYPHGMRELCKNIKVLDQSYRVPWSVWDVAEKTIKQIFNRQDKKYTPRNYEGYFNQYEIYNPVVLPERHAILCRDQWVMKDIERDLIQLGIPYVMEGVHGRGLFSGKWGQLARAIREGRIDYLQKRLYHLTPYAQDFIGRNELPPNNRWDRCLGLDHEGISYLNHVDLDEEPKITLSTIHSQKGKEHDHVVLISSVPNSVLESNDKDFNFENEVRVWYTGLTRAKKGVTLIGDNEFVKT